MSTHIHTLAATDLHSIQLGEDEFVGAPFAIPILPGQAISAELSRNGGQLFDLLGPSEVLHHEASMCTDDQALYVFPRLIDVACLARLLEPTSRRVLAQGMCLDYLTVLESDESRLEPLIPKGSFDEAPLAYMLGVIFTNVGNPTPLQLSNPRWWAQSQARSNFASQFEQQAASLGLTWPEHAVLGGPMPLESAFTEGLTALVARMDPQFVGMPQVAFTDATTVEVSMGPAPRSPRFTFSRKALSQKTLESLLARLDSLGLDMAVARACQTPSQIQ